ncbi:MAG: toprim domain-containing protein, partial [Nocardioides sp.]
GYLRGRLGSDLTDLTDLTDPTHLTDRAGAGRVAVGYAPPGPTSLLRHLLTAGATEQELLAAGLIKQRDRGDLIDTFRDRLLMPIRNLDDGAVVGFVGRRNPTRDDDDYAGPKYLNTRTTDAYTKGEHLFGLSDAGPALTAGAVPVLVEGPIDAWAITLATNGAAVGLAALGTALTPTQIELLPPHLAGTPHQLAVATDADPAGWRSAQTQFWALTAAGADPTQLALPTGRDPAQLFEHSGANAVRDALTRRRPLGDAMIDQHLHDARDWSATATRLTLVRQAAQIIAARPSETWDPAMKSLNSWLHLSPGILEHEVLHHSATRDLDPADYATQRISEIKEQAQRAPRNKVSRNPVTIDQINDPDRPDHHHPGPGNPDLDDGRCMGR